MESQTRLSRDNKLIWATDETESIVVIFSAEMNLLSRLTRV